MERVSKKLQVATSVHFAKEQNCILLQNRYNKEGERTMFLGDYVRLETCMKHCPFYHEPSNCIYDEHKVEVITSNPEGYIQIFSCTHCGATIKHASFDTGDLIQCTSDQWKKYVCRSCKTEHYYIRMCSARGLQGSEDSDKERMYFATPVEHVKKPKQKSRFADIEVV